MRESSESKPIFSTTVFSTGMKKTILRKRHWEARELVLIGVFAAAAKLSSLLIALAGGGMNPVSLVAKNLVYTTLIIVLLTKVPKPGTLLLFTVISMIVSVCLMGGSLTLLPAALAGALLGELCIWLTGGSFQALVPLDRRRCLRLGEQRFVAGSVVSFHARKPKPDDDGCADCLHRLSGISRRTVVWP